MRNIPIFDTEFTVFTFRSCLNNEDKILHWFTDHMTPFTGLRITNMMSCTGYRSPPWYTALAYRSPIWQLQTKKDSLCLARYRWCLLSVYHDIVICSQQKLKSFLATWPHFLMSFLLGRWYRVDTKWRTVISLGVLYVVSWNGVRCENTKKLLLLVPLTSELP